MTVETGIFKEPVDGPVQVTRLNVAGDRQADLNVHGGPYKAVYAYASEHYTYWRKQLPEAALSWGNFGENLTTEGLRDDAIWIGDTLRVGSALVQVTQPRMPCYKLALRFGREDMIKLFLAGRRQGFYFSVLQEGEVAAGSQIELVARDPQGISPRDIVALYLGEQRDRQVLDRALRVEALPESWKASLLERSTRRHAASS
jgi:MOSC domain-containing protein YiiM